jgi:predicted Zn-dependent peptidase
MHTISRLKNGITLIKIPVLGTRATTVMAMFPIGSRYEDKKISGASHFVEHMLFKGTQKRPTYLEISRELDSVGAHYNAFTNKDYTGYFIKIDSEKAELAFDMLSDMIFHSRFDAHEVEKEKGVIVEELRMYEDNPTMAVDLLFDKAIFGDHPLGWDIAGTEGTVKGMSREKLYGYYSSHYVPKNMVLLVAGKIDKKINRHLRFFSSESMGRKAKADLKKDFLHYNWPVKNPAPDRRVQASTRKVDQAHLIIGFPGIKINDPRRYAAIVLVNILSGGMSSRLFVEVREKRGLAYMINASGVPYRDVGYVCIQAGLDPSRLAEALQTIKNELIKIKTETVSPKELKNSKSNLSGTTTLAMEDSSAQAQWFAKQFLFADKMETYETTLAKIKKVTAAEVRKLAEHFFDFAKMRLAVISPYKKEEIKKIISSLK